MIVLGTRGEGRVNLLVAATPAAIARGVSAGEIVKTAAQVVGGGGGGRDNMAQAGGRDPEKLPDALEPRSARLQHALGLSAASSRSTTAAPAVASPCRDPTRTLATPVEPVLRAGDAPAASGAWWPAIGDLERRRVVVVGLPALALGRRLRPDAGDPRLRRAVEGSAQRAD